MINYDQHIEAGNFILEDDFNGKYYIMIVTEVNGDIIHCRDYPTGLANQLEWKSIYGDHNRCGAGYELFLAKSEQELLFLQLKVRD